MKEKIKCPKCGSDKVKEVEGKDDFLSHKGEGKFAKKAYIKMKQKYLCLEKKCGYKWEKDLN